MKKTFLYAAIVLLVVALVIGFATTAALTIIKGAPAKEYITMREESNVLDSKTIELIESKIIELLKEADEDVLDVFISKENSFNPQQALRANVLTEEGIKKYLLDTCYLEMLNCSEGNEERLIEIFQQATYSFAEDKQGQKTIIYID